MSCRAADRHYTTAVHRGTSLYLLPDKLQTLILASLGSCLQLFHPEAGAFLGSRSRGCPEASKTGSRQGAASARDRLDSLSQCLLT